MINVFDICYKVFVCPVYVIMHEDDQLSVFYICYKVFVCPVCNKMYEDDHCLWYKVFVML